MFHLPGWGLVGGSAVYSFQCTSVGTCAQEKHLIASISCIHLVHSYSCELVLDVGSHHKRLAVYGVDTIVHHWMSAHEVDHLIRIVLC